MKLLNFTNWIQAILVFKHAKKRTKHYPPYLIEPINNFKVLTQVKKYICKMNGWHWSDFHFNFERHILRQSENLSNIHCGSFSIDGDPIFFRQGHNHSLVKFQSKLLFMAYLAQMMETSRSRKVSRLTGFEWGSKSYWHWNAIRGSREELKPIWATNRSYQRDGKLNSKFDKSGVWP